MVGKWIQKSKLKKGALSRQLGIPIKENIPMSLLNTIVKKKLKQKIRVKGKYKTITPLMKRRAVMARNLKMISKKNKRRKR